MVFDHNPAANAPTQKIPHNYPADLPDFTRTRLKQPSHILDIPYTMLKA